MTAVLSKDLRSNTSAAWTSASIASETPPASGAELRASVLPLSGMPWRKARGVVAQELSRVRLVADADEELDTSRIEREFPTVTIERVETCDARETRDKSQLVIDDFAWRGAFDFRRFDEAVENARPVNSLTVRGSDAAGVACEVMARYQRLVARRNAASAAPIFDAVLEAHASAFGAVRFDLEHALDTWQWMLRLEPEIGMAPQIAALFHDIDRLESDLHERIEHRAHRALDDAQAKRGGERALAILRGLGIEEDEAQRVRDLVGGHVQSERDAAVLDDADALSFLSLMSPRYADYFGLAQTRRKVAFTLGRLTPEAREKVSLFRLRPDIERLLQPG